MDNKTKLFVTDLSTVGLSTDYLYAKDSNIKTDVKVEPVDNSGEKIATITVNGEATEISAKKIDVDDSFSFESTNPVQNKILTNELINFYDKTSFEVFPTNKDILTDDNVYDCIGIQTVDALPEKNYDIRYIYQVGDKKYVVEDDINVNRPYEVSARWTEIEDDAKLVTEYIGFETEYASGKKYKVDVPQCMEVKFHIWLDENKKDSTLVVDFGDNQENSIVFAKYDNEQIVDLGSGKLLIQHIYKNPGRYKVTLYGGRYSTFRNDVVENSLVSRILDEDLPIAKCISNMSSCCANSKRLLRVNVPNHYQMENLLNVAVMFTNSQLQYFNIGYASAVHKFRSYNRCFQNCVNLECNINNFNNLFVNPSEDGCNEELFLNCSKLYGTIDPLVYWNNPNKREQYYYETSSKSSRYLNIVEGCSDEIKIQVPEKWDGIVTGGTGSISLIVPSNAEIYKDINGISEKLDNIIGD